MKMAESMTFSADGTGHWSINYNSQHAHMLVEKYDSPDSNRNAQLDFLESNYLKMVLAKRLLHTGRQSSMKFLISIIVAHLKSSQAGV